MKKIFCNLLFLIVIFSLSACGSNNSTPEVNTEPTSKVVNSSITPNTNNNAIPNSDKADNITMSDIKKWYENNIPSVSQSLIEYTEANGLTNINISDSKFRFGEDGGWYDCHYTFYFDCKSNGEKCFGEARGFVEYQSDDISWFHFEVTKDANWSTVIEIYDDAYDLIIENYYKDLKTKYN